MRKSKNISMKDSSFKWVLCSRCQKVEMQVSEDAIGGICWICTALMVPAKKPIQPSEIKKRKTTKRLSTAQKEARRMKKEKKLADEYKKRKRVKRKENGNNKTITEAAVETKSKSKNKTKKKRTVRRKK